MRQVVMHGPGDVRVEQREDPQILEPTEAIIRLAATCICGSDLWPYRGVEKQDSPTHMGHEYAGVVEQVGDQVKKVKVGDFVVGPSSSPTTPARSARQGSSPNACTPSSSRRRLAPSPRRPASHTPTAPWFRHQGSRPPS